MLDVLPEVNQEVRDARSITIFNVFGHLNCGDSALIEALIDILGQNYPSHTLNGIAFDPDRQRCWCPEVNWAERIGNATSRTFFGRIQQRLYLCIAFLASMNSRFWPITILLPRGQREAVQKLKESSIAISCPGGYLEDSNYAYLVNCVSICLACSLSERVILAPQSIGPVKSALGKWMIKRVLRLVDRVFLREEESLKFVQELLGSPSDEQLQQKIMSVGDLAFWYSRQPGHNLDEELSRLGLQPRERLVGLSVIDWTFPHLSDPGLARENYKRSLCMLIEHVTAHKGYRIVIFNQVSSDLTLAKDIGRMFPQVVVDTYERESAVYVGLIGRCDLFVGSRLHSCIFALLGNVPTIAISYLPKTIGIMRNLGLEDQVIEINNVSGQSLISKFENMRKTRGELREQISDSVQLYREQQGGFLKFLSSISAAERKGLGKTAKRHELKC